MSDTYLIFDSNYLCHRAFYALKDVQFSGIKTGVFFGFFRDIQKLSDDFNTKRLIFTFDRPTYHRKKIFPEYKKRSNLDVEDYNSTEQSEILYKSIDLLREKLLKKIGYNNIFFQKGYEADDIIASLCQSLPEDATKIIVTSDSDSFQLLKHANTLIWHPARKKIMNEKSFTEELISPEYWHIVKAIAGDQSDNIKGVVGVGEKTAIKYLKKQLKKESKAYKSISEAGNIIDRNLELVTLPYPGVDEFEYMEDHIDPKDWNFVMTKLGIKTLLRDAGVRYA